MRFALMNTDSVVVTITDDITDDALEEVLEGSDLEPVLLYDDPTVKVGDRVAHGHLAGQGAVVVETAEKIAEFHEACGVAAAFQVTAERKARKRRAS